MTGKRGPWPTRAEHSVLATAAELSATSSARGEHRNQIGYTAGVFEMLHVGHLRLLDQARAHRDRLVVGVTTTRCVNGASPRRRSFRMRSGWKCSAGCDASTRSPARPRGSRRRVATATFRPYLRRRRLAGTESWRRYEATFAQLGVKVIYFTYTAGVSSTLVRQRLPVTRTA